MRTVIDGPSPLPSCRSTTLSAGALRCHGAAPGRSDRSSASQRSTTPGQA
jgi:hypothetical protein